MRADALTTEPLTALCSRATFKCRTRTGRGGPGPLGRALESAVTTHVFPTVWGASGIFGAQLRLSRSIFVEAGHWDEGRARVSPPHPGPCHPSPPPPRAQIQSHSLLTRERAGLGATEGSPVHLALLLCGARRPASLCPWVRERPQPSRRDAQICKMLTGEGGGEPRWPGAPPLKARPRCFLQGGWSKPDTATNP